MSDENKLWIESLETIGIEIGFKELRKMDGIEG